MTKAFKVLNLLSAAFFIAILLLVYASLPIEVDLTQMGNMHKQPFFYGALAVFVGINLLLQISLNLVKSMKAPLHAWMTALIFTLNLYLTFLIGFIGIWNNATHINPKNYAYLNYLGPMLIGTWLIGLVFLTLKQHKNSPKRD